MAYYYRDEELIASIDIGSSKVMCVVCKVPTEEGEELSVQGLHKVPARGITKGEVIRPAALTECIIEGMKKALSTAGCDEDDYEEVKKRISKVYVGMSGVKDNVMSCISFGMESLQDEGEVTERTMHDAIKCACAVPDYANRKYIHIIPLEYTVDRRTTTTTPLGTKGTLLESEVFLASASTDSYNNIVKCVNEAGFPVTKVILDSIASATAVLTQKERKEGVCMIDIGSATTDIAIYHKNALVYTLSIEIGGDNFTEALSRNLKCSLEEAEKLKRNSGGLCIYLPPGQPEGTFRVNVLGGNQPKTYRERELISYLAPVATELLIKINDVITKSGFRDRIPAGLVFTGGGSLFKNIDLLASRMGYPTRCGASLIARVSGLEATQYPDSSTATGLCLYGLSNNEYPLYEPIEKPSLLAGLKGRFSSFVSKAI